MDPRKERGPFLSSEALYGPALAPIPSSLPTRSHWAVPESPAPAQPPWADFRCSLLTSSQPSGNVSFDPSMSRSLPSGPGTAPARSKSPSAAAGPPGRRPATAQTPRLDARRAPRLCPPTARCPLRAGRRPRAPRSTCRRRTPTAAWTARPRPGPVPTRAPAAPWAVRPPRGPARALSARRGPRRPSTCWPAPAPRGAAPWPRGPRFSSRSAGPRRAPPPPTTHRPPSVSPCWARAAAPSPRLCAL